MMSLLPSRVRVGGRGSWRGGALRSPEQISRCFSRASQVNLKRRIGGPRGLLHTNVQGRALDGFGI